MTEKKHASLEFLAVMTFLGVIVAVLVLLIDRQIKGDIVRTAHGVRADVAKLQALISEREEATDAGSAADAAGSTD